MSKRLATLMHRYSELPWRKPLETNNTSKKNEFFQWSHASTKDFYILSSLHNKYVKNHNGIL